MAEYTAEQYDRRADYMQQFCSDESKEIKDMLRQAAQMMRQLETVAERAMERQPIETAPEDKLVLLYGGAEHRIEPGRVWHRYERVGSGTYPVFLGNAWTANATRDPATWPTHWMPLPEPPKVTP